MQVQTDKLGRAIKEIRELRGMTQKEVAAGSGLTVNYLSLVEHGDRNVTHDSLNQIAKAVDVPAQWIVLLGSDMPQSRRFAKLDRSTKLAVREMIRADTENNRAG
jgi:transcriptional regulator with XRE-family HTH domain